MPKSGSHVSTIMNAIESRVIRKSTNCIVANGETDAASSLKRLVCLAVILKNSAFVACLMKTLVGNFTLLFWKMGAWEKIFCGSYSSTVLFNLYLNEQKYLFVNCQKQSPEVFCKRLLQNVQENICVGVSFLIELQAGGMQLYEKGDSSTGIFLFLFANNLRAPILQNICQRLLINSTSNAEPWNKPNWQEGD